MTIRLIDMTLAFLGLVVGSPVLIVLWLVVRSEVRSPLFRQERIGRDFKPFVLVKFRTMVLGTESKPTHHVDKRALTSCGGFLRRTKLDEFPQLWNVLRGEMSLVGPRPCLCDQTELIAERAQRGVFDARPGVTGLAQIKGIDMSTPQLLAETDAQMLKQLNVIQYFNYILLTLLGKGFSDRLQEPL